MNILGIIAEFNPLHTGHAYFIQNLRRETGADYCVVVMSGDYVQRGEPAFFSKFLRTKAALSCGADLVLELPLSVSTGSAEYFAHGAVSLLDRLGCITHLGFGSESGNIQAFHSAGALLSEEPAAYRDLLQQYLKKGMSFPKARYEALAAFLNGQNIQNADFVTSRFSASYKGSFHDDSSVSNTGSDTAEDDSLPEDISDILSLLSAPNNILGTEYMKALHKLRSAITPVTIKRIGAGYHEGIIDASKYIPGDMASIEKGFVPAIDIPVRSYASASGLRDAFLSSPSQEETDILLENYVPESCRLLYLNALQKRQYITFDDFFLPLYYTLQYTDAEALSQYQDVTPEFAQKILSLFRQCFSVTELRTALKSKNLTSTRISRALVHILLHLTKDTVCTEKEQGFSLYARILGFRREARPLLSLIKKSAAIPLISKPADAPQLLSQIALSQFEQTIKASELYRAVLPGHKPGSEYVQNIVIL